MKAMSVIGIVMFSLLILCMLGSSDSDPDATLGFGLLGLLYSLAFSIAVVAFRKKNSNKSQPDSAKELSKWHELKEKGTITDDEFEVKKKEILSISKE